MNVRVMATREMMKARAIESSDILVPGVVIQTRFVEFVGEFFDLSVEVSKEEVIEDE